MMGMYHLMDCGAAGPNAVPYFFSADAGLRLPWYPEYAAACGVEMGNL
jgi:hypothetical protein